MSTLSYSAIMTERSLSGRSSTDLRGVRSKCEIRNLDFWYGTSQALFAETLRDQSRLANVRYVGGVSSYLEVLDTERQRLTAEQQFAQAQRDVLTSLVQLYKALGGGWQ